MRERHNNEYGALTKMQIIDFMNYLRHEVIYLTVKKDEYMTTPRMLAVKMQQIYDMQKALLERVAPQDKEVVAPIIELAIAIVQDGFARLAADAKEGMDYEAFVDRIEEERQLWATQLIVD